MTPQAYTTRTVWKHFHLRFKNNAKGEGAKTPEFLDGMDTALTLVWVLGYDLFDG
jgi:hypothetical protein